MKKPKKRNPSTNRLPPAQQRAKVATLADTPRKLDNRPWTVIKLIGAIGTVLGLLYTISRLWPQISIEPTAAAEPSNPFSDYFKITNEQGYPLTDVSVEVSLRCAKIGRGSDTSPPSKCGPSMHTSKQFWKNRILEPHESFEITPGDPLFVTPGALLSAQISFFVSYQPWKLPLHLSKELRFQSRRLADGRVEWLHFPAD